MECMRTGNGYQSGDGGVHSLQAYGASRKFVYHRFVGCRKPSNGGRSNILGVDRYGQNADDMAYLGLSKRMSKVHR